MVLLILEGSTPSPCSARPLGYKTRGPSSAGLPYFLEVVTDPNGVELLGANSIYNNSDRPHSPSTKVWTQLLGQLKVFPLLVIEGVLSTVADAREVELLRLQDIGSSKIYP